MATIKGANRTIMDAITPATVLDPGLAGGVVRCMIDTYTALGTEVATTVIEMGGDLPKGARVLKVVVYNGDAASTLAVGDAGSSGRYEDSVAATATEHISVAGGLGYEILTEPTATTPTNQLLLTVASATLTLGTVINSVVFYTID